ncbi:DsbA family protein [Pseudonocardia alni]|uniref:DsbA family protein n=1 Tax=Pseudonocardia alni TaxID=33907 RepID=UPI0036B2F8BD
MGRTTGNLERRGRQRDVTIVVVLVVLALGLIGYLVLGATGGDDAAPPATPGQSADAGQPAVGPLGDIARREEGDPAALGRTDAPVVMVAFSDYRCPFCAKFSRDTEQQLVDEYVQDGRLRIEWRDFPIFGPESTLAAQAGRAAAMQGRFWEFNKAVFADSPERAHPDLPEDTLVAYAEKVGVPDIAKFRTDMHGPEAAQAVQRDLDEGSALGVPSTPAFVVNGNPLMGAQPVAEFRAQIDQALAATR